MNQHLPLFYSTALMALSCGGSASSSSDAPSSTRLEAAGATTREPSSLPDFPDVSGSSNEPGGTNRAVPPEQLPVIANVPGSMDAIDSTIDRNTGCDAPPLGFDEIHTALLEDIESQPPEAQPFTRYILLSNQLRENRCSLQLDSERYALAKLLNMLSTEERIIRPTAIDSNELIYRFDLRDTGWDREVAVDGEVYADGWEATVAANPYAQAFVGEEALRLGAAAQTPVPWVFANSLTHATTEGNLYYALINVDVTQPLSQFFGSNLGINPREEFQEGNYMRVADALSGGDRNDRVVDRYNLDSPPGHLWLEGRFDRCCATTIFDEPLDFPFDERTAVFNLTNGFHGFAVTDEDDRVTPVGPPRFDPDLDTVLAPTVLALAAQYANGFPTIVNQVRAVVEENPANFNEDDLEEVLNNFPLTDELVQIQAADFATVQQAMLEAGIPVDSIAPVVTSVERFAATLTLADVAAELGVSTVSLTDALAVDLLQLPTAVGQVSAGSIPRDTFTENYLQSLCAVQAGLRNTPVGCD